MKNSTHSARKHSDFSASASERWLNCPGSVALIKKAPPQVESRFAREGTEAHECLEFIMERYKNLKRAETEALQKWPADMVQHAVNSATVIYSLRPSPSARLLVETRVSLKQISNRLYGTLDYAWIEDWGTLVVIDYKYGAGQVVLPADDDGTPNPQLLYYALGLTQKFGDDFEKLKLAIVQPRVWADGDSPVTVAEVDLKELKAFEKKIRVAINQAKLPNAPIRAGDHCKWCPAITICPENSKIALAEAEILFDVESGLQAMPEALALTPLTLKTVLPAIEKIEKWTSAVKEYALRLAEDGATIEGYKLVAKRAQRNWNPDAEEKAKEKFGESAYEKKLLSPAQLEKRYGSVAKKFTADNTNAISSGFNLVKESDKRSEVLSVSPFDTYEI